MFKLSLERRRSLARTNLAQYWRCPETRLARINAARRYRGAPEIESLEQAGTRRPVESRSRDDRGRFAPDAA